MFGSEIPKNRVRSVEPVVKVPSNILLTFCWSSSDAARATRRIRVHANASESARSTLFQQAHTLELPNAKQLTIELQLVMLGRDLDGG
jgi:hypothetical protein